MSAAERRPARWAVVGGGMLGAAAARRLRAAGAEVVLYESAAALGGLTAAWQIPIEGQSPVAWDRFYHVILGTDRRVVALVDELGVGPIIWNRTKAACYTHGVAVPASSAADLLGLPMLGPIAKVRIGLTAVWALLWSDQRRFDRITAAKWLRRWSGRQATEQLWMPLLRAKLGRSAESASAVFIWSTIRRLLTARLEGRAADRFGHVEGGYATLLGALAARLGEEGVDIRTGSIVTELRARPDGGLTVFVKDAEESHYDRVLVTVASPIIPRLCAELRDDERALMSQVEYLGVICPSVVLKRPVTGAYITYVTDPKPFTAVIEMTALVDPAEMNGNTLVYLPRYTEPGDPAFAATDDELRAEFLGAFLEMYGLEESDVLAFAVSRARYVMPVPTPGYADRVPPVRTSVAGLFALGSAQITIGTLNVEQTLQTLDEGFPSLDMTPITGPVPVVDREPV